MNYDLIRELQEMTERVNNLNTEAENAAKKLDNEIAKSREEKAKGIANFLLTMQSLLEEAEYPKNKRLSVTITYRKDPYDHYNWPIAVQLSRNLDIDFEYVCVGRQAVATGGVAKDAYITPRFGWFDVNRRAVYEAFVDAWSSNSECKIEEAVAKAVKETLENRMKKTTDRLKTANENHDKYFGG